MNYVALGGWFFLSYAYVDLENDGRYVGDSLICRHRVPVRFKGDMVKEGEKYRIILCKIRRKYRKEFEKALGEFENKMSLLGYNDYGAFCREFMKMLDRADQKD